MTRDELRQFIRSQRRQLSLQQQRYVAAEVARHLRGQFRFLRAQRVGLYACMQGEVDVSSLIDFCWQRNRSVYLPVLDYHKPQMRFYHSHPEGKIRQNRFGIKEPDPRFSRFIKANQLDLVLVPLVAFDAEGNRLGMGGGYYDRSFAFKVRAQSQTRPFLIGVAYDFQYWDKSLQPQAWDVGLDAVVTESGFKQFKRT